MLERVPTILTGQEVLDKAFHKAMKIEVQDPVRYHRIRKTEAGRMESVCDTISETLIRFHKKFPNLDQERDYDVAVLDIVTGIHELKQALGSVQWAAEKVQDVKRDGQERMRKARTVEGVKAAQNRCYGRASSIVYDINKALDVLRHTRDSVKALPSVSPDYATVVIAGYPNVGKTSLLRAWTASRAEINQYAFTTKHAEVGHFDMERVPGVFEKVQVVDTPGLLDRPEAKRNPVEKQAMAALRMAADAVLFLVDPSEICGYPLDKQQALLEQVRAEMVGIPMVVASSKSDLVRGDTELVFSTNTGDGLPALQKAIIAALLGGQDLLQDLDEDPLDAWR